MTSHEDPAPVSVLPAYAGMILDKDQHTQAMISAPRVCGDDPALIDELEAEGLCSPRMRG